MRKLNTPKRVMLPDGRGFFARCQRFPRSELPPNVIMRGSYKTRAVPKGRRRGIPQKGQGIISSLTRFAKNPLVRGIAKKGLEYTLGVYQNLTKRVKNKTLKRILNSDAAHFALKKAIKTANRHLKTRSPGTTNLEIYKFFETEENEDIKKIIWEFI